MTVGESRLAPLPELMLKEILLDSVTITTGGGRAMITRHVATLGE